jgi:hypothetical protein
MLRRKDFKAHDGIRTRDLFLTKEVLYRLSYMGGISGHLAEQDAPSPKPSLGRRRTWSGKRDSNPRPRAWKARALPTELFPLSFLHWPVERGGFEPPKA